MKYKKIITITITTLLIIGALSAAYLAYANFIVDPASTNYLKAGSLSQDLVGHWSLAKDDTRTGTTNKVVNGTFDTDVRWVKGTGWTINTGTGTADCDGSQTTNSNFFQNVATITAGEKYQITYTITSISAGTVRPLIGNTGAGTSRSTTGTYTEVITMAGTAQVFFQADADFIGSIDNVTVYDVTGNVVDLTPNNNAGTRVGTTWTTDRHGQADKALSFNGTSDYVNLGSSVDDIASGKTVGISVWIYTDPADWDNALEEIFTNNQGASANDGFFLSLDDRTISGRNKQILFSVANSGGSSAVLSTVEAIPSAGWYHIVAFDDGTNYKIYVNGVDVTNGTFPSGTYDANAMDLLIGYGGVSNYYFTGKISDLRFYDRVMTSAEVTSLYDNPTPEISAGSLTKGLAGDWSLSKEDTKPGIGADFFEVEDTTETHIFSLAVFDGYLYAGTYSSGKIYRSNDGTTWTEVEDTTETQIRSLVIFDGYLYAGTGHSGKIYRSNDGTTWTEVEDTTEEYIYFLAVFDDYLYAGAGNNGKIYRSNDGTTWTEVEDTTETYSLSLAVFDGYLYAGTYPSGKIYRSNDGTTWTEVEDTTETGIYSLAVFDGYLYAGTYSSGKIYRSKGYTADGIISDRTPNNNQGLRIGTTWTTDRKGQADKALAFNGTSDYIDLTSSISVFPSTQGSWSAWVKDDWRTDATGEIRIYNSIDSAGPAYQFRTFNNGTTFQWIVYSDTGVVSFGNLDTVEYAGLADGEWAHFVFTWEMSGTTINWITYVNGVARSSSTSSFGTGIKVPDTSIKLNKYEGGYHNTTVSDFRLYNRALSQTEVTTLYNTYK